MTKIRIPDTRSNVPQDYDHEHHLGQLKRSWPKGVQQHTDGTEGIYIHEGLSWGSIGQILGYHLGEVDEELQDDLCERLLAQYSLTNPGESLHS